MPIQIPSRWGSVPYEVQRFLVDLARAVNSVEGATAALSAAAALQAEVNALRADVASASKQATVVNNDITQIVTGEAGGIQELTGDVTAGPGSGQQAATLAASGVTAATYGSTSQIPQIAVDAKGRITSASNQAWTLNSTELAGSTPGNFTVTGIATTDKLVAVLDLTAGTVLTGEFTITAPNTINNGGGTDTTGDVLIVFWLDLTP